MRLTLLTPLNLYSNKVITKIVLKIDDIENLICNSQTIIIRLDFRYIKTTILLSNDKRAHLPKIKITLCC